MQVQSRRYPIGAEIVAQGGVHFRVWAPRCQSVELVLPGPSGNERSQQALSKESGGYFSLHSQEAREGDRYYFRLDHTDQLCPDPASRYQPEGPLAPSQVVNPSSFDWTDGNWRGVHLPGQVLYELHVGTFTPEGNWEAATRKLAYLADTGITVIELMPVADFPGSFGWSYDGVCLFAPTRLYGQPDDFRRFVNEAHRLGIAVILDIVYNHFGPKGNTLLNFSKDYVTDRYDNEWGDAINFDGPNSEQVREFFLTNAEYWIREFHLDGYRVDATQQFFDSSREHILTALTRAARAAAEDRSVLIIAENEPQDTAMIRSTAEGGHGMDGIWDDDFHHSARVCLTAHNEAYLTDYEGTASEFVSLAKWGFLYQGQFYRWQKKRRGTPTFGIPRHTFINFLQNHDQLANTGLGYRAHQVSSPGRFRAMTALLLLGPGTPMLFQGQEFCASTPFLYFSDPGDDLAEMVAKGREEFVGQFPSLATPEMKALLPRPSDPQTFQRCRLDHDEREKHPEGYRLHRDLLRLRRDDPVISPLSNNPLEAGVLAVEAFVLRYFGPGGDDRLLVFNFGRDLLYKPAPQPLLAPPQRRRWELLWSSEDPAYGGGGTPPLETEENWRVKGDTAVVLRASRQSEAERR